MQVQSVVNHNQDCDVGEFTMDDVTFTNVETAFSHGSGQGTVVTMSNFAVNDARCLVSTLLKYSCNTNRCCWKPIYYDSM